jgi:hypothetical protein
MLKPADRITQPDPLIASTSGADGFTPITVVEHHEAVASISLSSPVPAEVVEAFNRARNAFVYAWFSYDLGALAEAQAFFTVELALKVRLGARAHARDTASNLIEKAIKDGLLHESPRGQPGLAFSVRSMRNEWAHGSFHVHTPALTLVALEFCAGLINELFEPT